MALDNAGKSVMLKLAGVGIRRINPVYSIVL